MFRGAIIIGLVAVLAIAVGGCAFLTKDGLNTGNRYELRQGQPIEVHGYETLDDLFVKVAKRVPAFGGMFFGLDSQLYVYLTELTQKAAVTAAIAEVFAAYRPDVAELAQSGGFQVLKGKYGFLQLKEWYDRMTADVLTIAGVTLTDIDEAQNRLRVGVEKMELASVVEKRLAKLSIPRGAVIIEEMGPIEVMPLPAERAP